jgi:hypothetical protein
MSVKDLLLQALDHFYEWQSERIERGLDEFTDFSLVCIEEARNFIEDLEEVK